MFDVAESSITELARALASGETTAVELVETHLRRIAAWDRHGPLLNAVVRLSPAAFAEAEASDRRRARGEDRGVLDGIPFIAKDSFSVRGMPVSAGSPAFARLIAGRDAHAIAVLRRRGAVFLGLTNMPPMADGGMQRGLYGRAESPYNRDFLTAAYQSGSSNGSGTGVAASFAAFGLGEETWSSGRAPASNNGLAAYTPSRGVISVRGNWPLVPTMDVVVPYARSVEDLAIVSAALAEPDPDTAGDFWREQPCVELPPVDPPVAGVDPADLAALRLAVPDMYVGRDREATTPIETRASVIDLFERMLAMLRERGAGIDRTDFPVITRYEGDRPGAPTLATRGIVPPGFLTAERHGLTVHAWDRFLRLNDDPDLHALADVDGAMIFPQPPGAVPFSDQTDVTIADYVQWAREHVPTLAEIDELAAGLQGLEATRRVDLEQWLADAGRDAVLLPTVADIGPFDADFNPASNRIAMRNGTWVANGNQAIRHLGIPTVTVPLGLLPDIGMPIGVTVLGPSGSDRLLFRIALAIERMLVDAGGPFGRHRPTRLADAALEDAAVAIRSATPGADRPARIVDLRAEVGASDVHGLVPVTVTGRVEGDVHGVRVTVMGRGVPVSWAEEGFRARARVDAHELYRLHSTWRGPYGALATAVLVNASGRSVAGAWADTTSVG